MAAEGVQQLLYPLRWPHVYIPVMAYSLVDYLEVRSKFSCENVFEQHLR